MTSEELLGDDGIARSERAASGEPPHGRVAHLTVRCEPRDLRRWKRAARAGDDPQSLSRWVRRALNLASRGLET